MKGKYFHAEVDPKKKPYTIVIPPPNITGQLHLGHAMDETLQDTLIRWRRMQGYSALWLPGTDHASIATEAKIVEAMRKEGITKEEIGREKFLERAWAWKDQYGGRIVEQLKKLGSSCDWDRLRFTMDEGCNKAVNHVFKKLYDKGLIYRGERIINWCPHCKTSISDAEVVFEEKEGSFWHLRYPLSDGSGYIELATTRPETMLGDTAVAVHPDDERYKALVGKTVILPLVNKEIPIIADSYVEQDFGTGVVKITPAHDPVSYTHLDVYKRQPHNRRISGWRVHRHRRRCRGDDLHQPDRRCAALMTPEAVFDWAIQTAVAFVATIAFSIIFHTPREQYVCACLLYTSHPYPQAY